jgi:EAL and modified HD-GYP domain-containing signal transduction protein
MQQFYLGRQPIFDSNIKLVGYELLYRAIDNEKFQESNGDQATSTVLLNSLVDLGLARVVGDHRAFINLSRSFVINHRLLPPASNQLVLELLESILYDAEIIQAMQELRKSGYVLALDDFVYEEESKPLLKLVDIVKLDVQALSRTSIEQQIEILKQHSLLVIAEKVETPDEFDWCKEIGFDYYQGFFLGRPRVIAGKRMPINRLNCLRLMARIHDTKCTVDELEDVVSQDITLSYKLLQYINSAAFPTTKKIESIRHAIVYLGDDEVRRWASMLALANLDDKPGELLMTSLTRSKMCELLTENIGTGNRRTAFIVGLFSTLDAIMDSPLQKLLKSLPLIEEITEALLTHKGPYGEVLECTLAYERGDWDQVACDGLSQETIAEIYIASIEWAEVAIHHLGDRR